MKAAEPPVQPQKSFIWALAFVPGAAQYRRGDYGKCALFLGGLAATGAGAVYYSGARDDALLRFKSASTAAEAESSHNASIVADQNFTALSYAAVGFYVVNVLDAFLHSADASPASKIEASRAFPSLSLGVGPSLGQELRLEWKI